MDTSKIPAIVPLTKADGIFLDAVLAEQDNSDDDEQASDDARHEHDRR